MHLDIKPENKGVQEQKKGVLIMINYHSDKYIFLAHKNIYFRGRVCFNGTVCAADLVFILGGKPRPGHQENCQKEGRKRALAGKPKGKRIDLRS